MIVPPRRLRLLRSHIRALRHPRAYFSTLWQALRSAHAGGRARRLAALLLRRGDPALGLDAPERRAPHPCPPRERVGRRRAAGVRVRQPRGRGAAMDLEHHDPRPDRAARHRGAQAGREGRGRVRGRLHQRLRAQPGRGARGPSHAREGPHGALRRRPHRVLSAEASEATTGSLPRSSASRRCRAARATWCCWRRSRPFSSGSPTRG